MGLSCRKAEEWEGGRWGICGFWRNGTYGDLQTLIGEDEGGVGGSELGGGHFARMDCVVCGGESEMPSTFVMS
jgi:hypothetical protein